MQTSCAVCWIYHQRQEPLVAYLVEERDQYGLLRSVVLETRAPYPRVVTEAGDNMNVFTTWTQEWRVVCHQVGMYTDFVYY